MTKIDKISESANDSLQISASANEKGIQIFNNQEFGNVRVAIINGEPFFCLLDLCSSLQLTPKGVKQRLSHEVISNYPIIDSLGRAQNALFINEDGLYDVVFDSRKQEAKRFRKWVTSEVLPSIRKTGSYSIDNRIPKTFAEALRLAADQQEKIEEQQKLIEVQKPKADYFDGLIERGNNLNFRDTVKLLGIGEKAFIFMLIDNKYIYRDAKGKLKPIAKYVDKYFVLKEWNREENGKAGTQTLITVKGREYFKKIVDDILRERQ